MPKNKDLKKFYDNVYKKGERKHYTPLLLFGDKVPPAKTEVLREISWKGKTVLDAGCGTGELAGLIAKKGAKMVVGIDYSKDAILAAQKNWRAPNLEFFQKDINQIKEKFSPADFAMILLSDIVPISKESRSLPKAL
jgi:2-polyprenyl-3-methyl-5-hydroxy-6-metoxy-1,4-benzoquinol methylase